MRRLLVSREKGGGREKSDSVRKDFLRFGMGQFFSREGEPVSRARGLGAAKRTLDTGSPSLKLRRGSEGNLWSSADWRAGKPFGGRLGYPFRIRFRGPLAWLPYAFRGSRIESVAGWCSGIEGGAAISVAIFSIPASQR